MHQQAATRVLNTPTLTASLQLEIGACAISTLSGCGSVAQVHQSRSEVRGASDDPPTFFLPLALAGFLFVSLRLLLLW